METYIKKSGRERETVFLDVNKKALQIKWKMMGTTMNYESCNYGTMP